MVTNCADAIALVDRDGSIRFVSGSVERISGHAPSDVIGRNALERIHPDDLARVHEAFLATLAQSGLPVAVEYRARHKDGSWRHREVIGVNRLDDPAVRSIVVNYRETTARKQAEAALAERDRAYRSTFEEAPVGIAHTSLDGRFLVVNQWLCDLLGYTAEELTATDFIAISHPDEVGEDIDGRARLVAGSIRRYSREKRYRRKDGTFVWANLRVNVHRDINGTPSYFIAIIEDLTARKQLEQQARQAHKMEAVGRLAGGIAHDFSNLLTAIVGFAELTLAELGAEHPVRPDVEEIRAAGKSAGSLTRQLLAFSRQRCSNRTSWI
jgi:PAS domain S-box-containing protein